MQAVARWPGIVITAIAHSRVNYWATFAIDFTAASLLFSWGISSAGASWPGAITSLAGGWLAWTLFEYLVHRFIFHGHAPLIARAHLEHHRAPRDPIGLPFFVPVSIAAAWWICLSALLGEAETRFAVAGSYAGFLWYSCIHHAIHALVLRDSPLAHRQRMHAIHHARMRWNFGATTDLWDRVFGTHSPRLVRRPPADRS